MRIERDLDAVLPHVDAIMMLRIQRERIVAGLLPSLDDYTRGFQLSAQRLRLLPKRCHHLASRARTTAASS